MSAVASETVSSEIAEPSGTRPEMERWRIVSFADSLRALHAHPEWLEQLRKLILASELLELPRKVDELIRRVENIEGDLAILK